MSPPIFLLTDFGTTDPFVGIMKAVINRISPHTQLIDLTHEIPPGDIRSGAVILWQSLPYLPKGSVILSVIDPGVGTSRRPVILQSKGFSLIGPDNGTFTYILEENARAWDLTNPDFSLPPKGTTFHGRDIFAPAAAHAALGIPAEDFGFPVENLVRIPAPRLSRSGKDRLDGEVIHIDHFGNVLTSLGQFSPLEQGNYSLHPWIGACDRAVINLPETQIHLPGHIRLKWASTFAEIPEKACGFVLGSSGLIEIAANRQNAAQLLSIKREDPVTLVA